ncbi:hypothetical protein [Clostridium sp. FP1]|nr:hypothetical protein [Clostridium sp. FP1]MBZ9635521.1 hypothetical protein [Clostridium sp. FP1]
MLNYLKRIIELLEEINSKLDKTNNITIGVKRNLAKLNRVSIPKFGGRR